MLRALLVAHLIVGTLTAPRPCPCSLPPVGATTTSAPVRDDTGRRSCGCCAGNTRPVGSAPRVAGEPRPEQPSDPCQCRCGVAVAAVARSALRSESPGGLSDHGFFGFAGPLIGFLPVPAEGAFRVPLGPLFVTADDLLHVFHNLRC